MNRRKIIIVGFDCFIVVGFYWILFGLANNPINEFRLLSKGIITQATVDFLDGLDSNKNESMLLLTSYHYRFTTRKGETFKSSQLIFIGLKDVPETAKPKFLANVTYLESNPKISSFTSTIASSFLDLFFRRIGLGLLFVSIIYFPLKFIIRYDYKQSKIEKEESFIISN